MALTKRKETQITVLPDGQLQQRVATIIEEEINIEESINGTY